MKKNISLLTFVLFIGIQVFSQERITVNAGNDMNTAFSNSRYLFPQFQNARVVLQGRTLIAKMNYNALTGDMEFMNENGTILALSEHVDAIVLGNRLFKYSPKGYIEVLAYDSNSELLVRTKYAISDRRKRGAYGTLSSTSSIESLSSLDAILPISPDLTLNTQRIDLVPDEEVTYKKVETFYIFSKGKYLIANKSNFAKEFGKQKIDNFLKSDTIDFMNREDVKRLFTYCMEQ